VIIDINMPERDCLFLMDEFSERRKEIPMLMMSDYHIAETVEEVTRRGAADFLSTPFTPDEFFQAVRGVIRKEEIHGST
jgi:DNA-binding NtrC family response regulator